MIRRRMGSEERFQHRGHREQQRGSQLKYRASDGLLRLDVSVNRFPFFAISISAGELLLFRGLPCHKRIRLLRLMRTFHGLPFRGAGGIAFATRHLFSVEEDSAATG